MAKDLTAIILMIFIGGLAGVERFALFQFSLSRPFIISVIMGYMFNFLTPFLYIGLFFEILWLYKLPIGSVTPPHEVIGVFSSLITYYMGINLLHGNVYIVMSWAIFVGIIAGWTGKRADSMLRLLITRISSNIEVELEKGNVSVLNGSLFRILAFNLSFHFFSLLAITVISLVLTYILLSINILIKPSYIFATSLSTILIGGISIIYNRDKFKVFTAYFLLTLMGFMIYNFLKWDLI